MAPFNECQVNHVIEQIIHIALTDGIEQSCYETTSTNHGNLEGAAKRCYLQGSPCGAAHAIGTVSARYRLGIVASRFGSRPLLEPATRLSERFDRTSERGPAGSSTPKKAFRFMSTCGLSLSSLKISIRVWSPNGL